jgi:hypothetical protein
MKTLTLLFSLISLLSCQEQTERKEQPLSISSDKNNYDTSVYNTVIIPDTSGCTWIAWGREIIDTLINRKCFFKATSDTFLTTGDYRRLHTCRIPSFLKISGDTILVTGYIYRIYVNDGTRGNPTIISKIIYSKPQSN